MAYGLILCGGILNFKRKIYCYLHLGVLLSSGKVTSVIAFYEF